MRAQFTIEFRNAFNHPIANDPNTDPTNADVGNVTSQANLPRDIQIAAKIVVEVVCGIRDPTSDPGFRAPDPGYGWPHRPFEI